MSIHSKKYYLYKNKKLVGPISQQKLDQLRTQNELLQYHWLIDSETQQWVSIDPLPTENPFLKTEQAVANRELHAAFLTKLNAFSGKILGLHSYGLELFIPHAFLKQLGLKNQDQVPLNLIDLSNQKFINTHGIFQTAEQQENGLVIHLTWAGLPASL